jgi:hypothetical protein
MDDTGAKFEISIDGTPRTYRDTIEMAREAAELLKRRNPTSKVAVRDLQTNERAFIEGLLPLVPR